MQTIAKFRGGNFSTRRKLNDAIRGVRALYPWPAGRFMSTIQGPSGAQQIPNIQQIRAAVGAPFTKAVLAQVTDDYPSVSGEELGAETGYYTGKFLVWKGNQSPDHTATDADFLKNGEIAFYNIDECTNATDSGVNDPPKLNLNAPNVVTGFLAGSDQNATGAGAMKILFGSFRLPQARMGVVVCNGPQGQSDFPDTVPQMYWVAQAADAGSDVDGMAPMDPQPLPNGPIWAVTNFNQANDSSNPYVRLSPNTPVIVHFDYNAVGKLKAFIPAGDEFTNGNSCGGTASSTPASSTPQSSENEHCFVVFEYSYQCGDSAGTLSDPEEAFHGNPTGYPKDTWTMVAGGAPGQTCLWVYPQDTGVHSPCSVGFASPPSPPTNYKSACCGDSSGVHHSSHAGSASGDVCLYEYTCDWFELPLGDGSEDGGGWGGVGRTGDPRCITPAALAVFPYTIGAWNPPLSHTSCKWTYYKIGKACATGGDCLDSWPPDPLPPTLKGYCGTQSSGYTPPSGHHKSSAIVPTKLNASGFVKWFVTESPMVRFEDYFIAPVTRRVSRFPIDPLVLEGCESGSIEVVGLTADRGFFLGSAGAHIAGGYVVIDKPMFSGRRTFQVHLAGIRKGFGSKRLPDATLAEFQANEAFLKMADPKTNTGKAYT